MTRTDNKPLFRNRSAARCALLDERARGMRASLTPSEALLRARIRGRRFGVVFRRQVPLLGRFIADFLAPAERLVIEVDGGYHAEQSRADSHRDAALATACFGWMPRSSCMTSRLRSGSSARPSGVEHQRKNPRRSGAGDSFFRITPSGRADSTAAITEGGPPRPVCSWGWRHARGIS